jgi:hypothetical protein
MRTGRTSVELAGGKRAGPLAVRPVSGFTLQLRVRVKVPPCPSKERRDRHGAPAGDIAGKAGQPRNCHRVAKTGQIGRDSSATLAAMTTQTIPEYLEEERQKAADTQLRTEEEAARIQPLRHGRHRKAKQPKLKLLAPVKAATKKKTKKKTAAVARKKPRASGRMAAKTRKRA